MSGEEEELKEQIAGKHYWKIIIIYIPGGSVNFQFSLINQ